MTSCLPHQLSNCQRISLNDNDQCSGKISRKRILSRSVHVLSSPLRQTCSPCFVQGLKQLPFPDGGHTDHTRKYEKDEPLV
uniref:Uncharacterized protein n=1 Tax=Populus trichocarpa TaxID=3694 RepID=A0A2K1XFJ3_POPTR